MENEEIATKLGAVLDMSGYREIVDKSGAKTLGEAFNVFVVARGLREIVPDTLPLPEALALAAKVCGCEAALS